MSANRRSNKASQQPQSSQSHSLNLTPIKKSPTKQSTGNQQQHSLLSTAASIKESKVNNNLNTPLASGDLKELRLQPQQRSQQLPNNNQQQYNLRSSTSSNLNNTLTPIKSKQNQLNKSGSSIKSCSPSPLKTSNIKPFEAKIGKENDVIINHSATPSPVKVKANKTLNLKNTHNQITTNKTPLRKSTFFSENKQTGSGSQDMFGGFRFETQRINLPRGKVVRCSPQSSANGSKRNSQSPVKLPRNMPPLQDPKYEHNVDYFKEYWRMYFQNETLVADIEQTAHSNYKAHKKIYNLEDYYEHSLIPQLLTYPHKFLHRLRQQQLQKQQQQQKLLYQQKQQQELLMQMKHKSDNNSSSQSHLGFANDNKNSQGSEGGNNHSQGNISQQNNENSQNNNHNNDSSSSQVSSKHNHNTAMSQAAVILGLNKDRMNKRKKHLRRTAAEIEREFICPYAECGKFYGSEGSLNLHIKIKHNGGNKTERERLAKQLVQAFINGSINKEIETLDLNLPPGALQKAVKKAGLVQQISEKDILRQITQFIQQHQAVARAAVIGGNGVVGHGIGTSPHDEDDDMMEEDEDGEDDMEEDASADGVQEGFHNYQ